MMAANADVPSQVVFNRASTLTALSGAGVPLRIRNNKPRLTTITELAVLGRCDLFKAIICHEDVVHRKPDERHLLVILAAMGCSTNGAVDIGDRETALATARDAGIPVILVTFGYSHQSAVALGADALVSFFHKRPGALASIRGGA